MRASRETPCDTVIVAAMECEAASIESAMEQVEKRDVSGRVVRFGLAGGRPAAVLVSGIGKTNAAAATQFAISVLGAKRIFNAGLCGGFGDGVEKFGVYEVEGAAEYDFDLAAFNGGRIAVKDGRSSPFVRLGTKGVFPARLLATGDRFSDCRADDTLITETLGCSLRDMEGAAVAAVAEMNGVECRAVKCVSDVSGDESMTGAYLENRSRSLDALAAALRVYFAKEDKEA